MSNAKSYERLGRRIKVQENEETKKLLLDDTVNNIHAALEKDGHTGFLGERDGILRGAPQKYKGFYIQCFGMKKYQSDLDVFGSLKWFGWAKREIRIKGRTEKIEFATECAQPLGFDTEHEAGNWLFRMIDLFQNSYKN